MLKKPPFFILANPRSGSSLLRIICDSHSNITVPPECGFMEWWFEKYRNWSLKDASSQVRINAFLEDLKESKKIETWNLNMDNVKDEITIVKPSSYQDLIELIYRVYGRKRKDKLLAWGDKNNYYINMLPKLIEIYPKAKFIHLVRDGRDVASSYLALTHLKSESKYIPKLSSNISKIAKEWATNNRIISKFILKLQSNQALKVRYEDLILNTEAECKRICIFLEVPFDKSMLNYYQLNQLHQLEPKETIDWKKKTKEKPDSSRIGQFREQLTTQEIKDFKELAAAELNRYGYK